MVEMYWRQISQYWMVVFAWVLANMAHTASAGCSKLTIRNTMWQGNREGTYKRTSDTCTDRPVYHENKGNNYLYYIEATGGWHGWMVGTSSCVNSGGIAVQDSAENPEDVNSIWEEVYGGNWYYSSHMEVKCYRLSGAAIAGIVVACVVVVGVVILIVVCCCCKKNKNNTTVQTTHTTNVSYTTTSNTVRYNGQRAFVQPQPPGYYAGPPAYGSPMVHGYGPPPAYTGNSNVPANATSQGGVDNHGADLRPESVPPQYVLQAPSGQADPFAYPTKVGE